MIKNQTILLWCCVCSLLSVDMERTFIAVKPDGVQRGLCGEIIKRFEHRGFRLVAAKFTQVNMTMAGWAMVLI